MNDYNWERILDGVIEAVIFLLVVVPTAYTFAIVLLSINN